MTPQKAMTMKILWAALVMSTVVFFGVAVFVTRSGYETPQPDTSVLFALALVSAVTAAASVVLPRHMLRQALRALELRTEEVEAKDRMFTDSPRRPRRFSDSKRARQSLTAAALTSMIVGMALAESIALYGVVLMFLGHPVSVCGGFFGACWLLMAAKFPNPGSYERQLEQVYDAELEPLPAQSLVR